MAEGYEVNLFAGDPLLAKPIQINFDAQGRLWVASSEVYPQIQPGQVANDKILVLEDKDGDGKISLEDFSRVASWESFNVPITRAARANYAAELEEEALRRQVSPF